MKLAVVWNLHMIILVKKYVEIWRLVFSQVQSLPVATNLFVHFFFFTFTSLLTSTILSWHYCLLVLIFITLMRVTWNAIVSTALTTCRLWYGFMSGSTKLTMQNTVVVRLKTCAKLPWWVEYFLDKLFGISLHPHVKPWGQGSWHIFNENMCNVFILCKFVLGLCSYIRTNLPNLPLCWFAIN